MVESRGARHILERVPPYPRCQFSPLAISFVIVTGAVVPACYVLCTLNRHLLLYPQQSTAAVEAGLIRDNKAGRDHELTEINALSTMRPSALPLTGLLLLVGVHAVPSQSNCWVAPRQQHHLQREATAAAAAAAWVLPSFFGGPASSGGKVGEDACTTAGDRCN